MKTSLKATSKERRQFGPRTKSFNVMRIRRAADRAEANLLDEADTIIQAAYEVFESLTGVRVERDFFVLGFARPPKLGELQRFGRRSLIRSDTLHVHSYSQNGRPNRRHLFRGVDLATNRKCYADRPVSKETAMWRRND